MTSWDHFDATDLRLAAKVLRDYGRENALMCRVFRDLPLIAEQLEVEAALQQIEVLEA